MKIIPEHLMGLVHAGNPEPSATNTVDMNNNTATIEAGQNVMVDVLPLKQNEMDKTAPTVSPMSDNLAGEHGMTDRHEDNSISPVLDEDPETAAAKNSKPKNKTADELMGNHVGEVPKAEKKFSLASLKSKSEEAVPKSNTKPGTITVAKPNDDTFVRTSTKMEEWAAFDFIELKTDSKKLFLLTPDVVEKINALNEDRAQVIIKTVTKRLIYSVTRLGVPFLWPITIMDGNSWIDSANKCAEAAKENWVRIVSNQPASSYDYFESTSTAKPKWPAMTYEDALLKAFEGKVIDSMDHDVIRQLLGED